MPVGFNSPARNFFLLGSSGDGVVGNFFDRIDQSAGADGKYLVDQIRYNDTDQKYLLAGSAETGASKRFGWFEKRDDLGAADFDVRVEATSDNTTLNAMELDGAGNILVAGKTANNPWIAKYSNGGVIDWQSTTFSADVEYTGIAIDSNNVYYACGNAITGGDDAAFIEKYSNTGVPDWGKSSTILGGDVKLNNCAANSRGEVVAVGSISDNRLKGYIVKVDTTTGDVLWDRTLTSFETNGAFLQNVSCEDVYVDGDDEIYVVGWISNIGTPDIVNDGRGFIAKYTAEGNLLWQRETVRDGSNSFANYKVKADTGTKQLVVFSRYNDSNQDDLGVLSKYGVHGDLVWRRKIYISNTDKFGDVGGYIGLDADPSFYYIIYTDQTVDGLAGTPDQYTYGKVSSSGNGLGDFYYDDGSETVFYEILNIGDQTGRLQDGSLQNNESDLISVPFSPTKLLFDDLATHVANKKVQIDQKDTFEYSGSPAIRPADFQEINLIPEQGVSLGGSNPLLMDFRGSSYTGSGAVLDESGNGKEMTGNAIWTSGTKYFQFNSSTPTVNETTNPLGASRSTPFTMEVWAARGTSASWQTIMTITNTWTQMAFDGAGQIRCGRNGGSGGINASTSFTANVDQWYHIVMTYDGNDNGTNAYITIYVDGVAVTGATDMGVNSFGDNGQYIRLGTHAGGGEYLNGRIGEVRVYDRELTPNEVLNNYLGSKDRYHGGGNSGSGLVINDGNLWADSSSKKNDAVIGITQFQPTYNNTYFTYNGNTTSGDYVRLTNLVHDHVTEPDWSYEMWFRTSSGHGVLFGQQMNPFPNVTTGWVPALHLNSDGTLRAEPFWTTTGTSSADVTSGTNYRDGNWHHVVVTRENNVQRMYVDGSLETTGSSHTPSGYHSVYYYFIGAGKINVNRTGSVDGQPYFNGDIGDFRFYKRPLTAAQVFQNYNATKETFTGVAASTNPGLTSTRTP